jgi:hypothetical protein
MSQYFSVNGKKFVQSNTLVASSGYTSDYLGKLAREEKIIGTQIGRQWFIEPESLKTFLLKVEVEKEIRKSELSAQRKVEHLVHQKIGNHDVSVASSDAVLLAQSVIVFLCGIFFGGLGWLTVVSNTEISQISNSTRDNFSFIAQSISPSRAVHFFESSGHSFVATARESVGVTDSEPETTNVIFTELPKFPPRENFVASSTVAGLISAESQFSDDVQVVVDARGNTVVEPVFKNASSSAVKFMLVPVETENEYEH